MGISWRIARLGAASLLAACGLAGCFDMKQGLNVADDGTATFAMEISVDAAILAMGQQNNSSDFCNSSTFPERDGVAVDLKRTTERGDVICTVQMSGTLQALSSLMTTMVPESPSAQAGAPKMEIALTQEGDNYRFEAMMPISGMFPEQPDNGGMDMRPMLAAMLAGRSLSWSVTAPKIVETSGEISDDGQTASYSFPLALAAEPGQEDLHFNAVFTVGRAKFLGIF